MYKPILVMTPFAVRCDAAERTFVYTRRGGGRDRGRRKGGRKKVFRS
jgi:hypothetical protein